MWLMYQDPLQRRPRVRGEPLRESRSWTEHPQRSSFGGILTYLLCWSSSPKRKREMEKEREHKEKERLGGGYLPRIGCKLFRQNFFTQWIGWNLNHAANISWTSKSCVFRSRGARTHFRKSWESAGWNTNSCPRVTVTKYKLICVSQDSSKDRWEWNDPQPNWTSTNQYPLQALRIVCSRF